MQHYDEDTANESLESITTSEDLALAPAEELDVHPYTYALNDTGITPTGYHILVIIDKSDIAERLTAAGLYTPETSEDARVNAGVIGKVLQLGLGAYSDPNRTPGGPWCFPGDLILLPPYTGMRLRSRIHKYKDAAIRLITDDSVIGVVADKSLVERF